MNTATRQRRAAVDGRDPGALARLRRHSTPLATAAGHNHIRSLVNQRSSRTWPEIPLGSSKVQTISLLSAGARTHSFRSSVVLNTSMTCRVLSFLIGQATPSLGERGRLSHQVNA